MRYLSVCSGIEAASVAWHHLGWTPVAFSEIEPFPAAVLAHRFPNVPNYGDMTQHEQWPIEPGSIDLLVGGTPCQSFSVAGLRKGISDPRGGLMLTYLEIARRLRPRWIVWENVPGVLSSGGGRDFGSFLGALGELGYGWAYRVLDAQWVRTQRHPRAVPQRRRRVFVVGCLGNWERAAQVLFERESVQRDSAPRRAQGQGPAADAEAGVGAGCWQHVAETLIATDHKGPGHNRDHNFIPQPVGYRWQNDRDGLVEDGTAPACRASAGSSGFHEMNHPVIAHAFYSTDVTHSVNQHPEVSPAVKVGSGLGIPSPPAVAVAPSLTATNDPSRSPQSAEVTQQVAAVHASTMTVRRLTPVECERLQGFPDNWTAIPWRKKPAEQCPDGPRYRALGNSMACNCMSWIGERIAAWESAQ